MNWELDFKRCLDKRWLVSMPEARLLVKKELSAAHRYREKSHHCLAVAMRYLFVNQRSLDEKLVDALDDARALREEADYRMEFSETGARHSLNDAKQLVEQAGTLLSDWKESLDNGCAVGNHY